MASLHDIILARLCDVMAAMNESDARAAASELTSRLNAMLSGQPAPEAYAKDAQHAARNADFARALPVNMMNISTLPLPWLAFDKTHRLGLSYRAALDDDVNIVCSIPELVERAMRGTLAKTGIWPGGILDCLAGLLASATEEVLMISPYWSAAGVETIARRMANHHLRGVKVTIMTLPSTHHKPEALRGLSRFREILGDLGAECETLSFCPSSVWTPLLHAKALVADKTHGYIGSANLTSNGLDGSVELGVVIHGTKAVQLASWMRALSAQLTAWEK